MGVLRLPDSAIGVERTVFSQQGFAARGYWIELISTTCLCILVVSSQTAKPTGGVRSRHHTGATGGDYKHCPRLQGVAGSPGDCSPGTPK